MKRYIIYIIGVLLGQTMAAQVNVSWTPATTVQLGTLDEADGVVRQHFVARNTGDYSWQVVRGYTSCGCTRVELQQEQVVRPGDSAVVNVSFDPKGKAGPVREVVTVQLTDGEMTLNEALTLTGEVRRSRESLVRQFPVAMGNNLRVSRSHVDHGEIRRGNTAERHIAVCNTSPTPLTLRATTTAASLATEWPDSGIMIGPDETVDLIVRWDGGKERRWGLTHEQLRLACEETNEQLDIDLTAILLPPSVNDPAKAPALQTERRLETTRQSTTQQLTLRNTGNAPLQVLRIYGEQPEIRPETRLPLRIEPGKSATVVIRTGPSDSPEIPITIISDDARRPRQTVRIVRK